MTKFVLCLAIMAMSMAGVQSACEDVENCNSCENKGPVCDVCPAGTVLSQDHLKCLDCGTGCAECVSENDDTVTCTTCMTHYYLTDDDICGECATGCDECHMNGTILVCDECSSSGYVMDSSSAIGECKACSSNCVTCSYNTVTLATKCSACATYVGLGKKGYYLVKFDNTASDYLKCKACPNNCEKCTQDTGTGAVKCDTCQEHYYKLDDESDDDNDGTKCLSCDKRCTNCNGIEISSGKSECTECATTSQDSGDTYGYYLTNGECTECTTGCKVCLNDDTDLCGECMEGYRLEEDGSCTACPVHCDICSVDDDGNDICETCDDDFGSKLSTSITCDACDANCVSCTFTTSTGLTSCSTCKSGYRPTGSGCEACTDSHCTRCAGNKATCDATYCEDGYTSDSSSTGTCSQCPSGCDTCSHNGGGGLDTDTVVCDSCDSGKYKYTGGSYDTCEDTPTGCDTPDASNAAAGKCTSGGCSDGYYYDGAGDCVLCTSGLNCETCNDGISCATCPDTHVLKAAADANNTCATACGVANCDLCNSGDETTCGTCADGYTTNGGATLCEQCTDANCDTCTPGDNTQCSTCDDGYGLKSSDKTCVQCPSKCHDCDVNEASADATTCKNGECQAWDNLAGSPRAYFKESDGTCTACLSKCESCSAADTCSSCTTGYTYNSNTLKCEACPSNCDTCEYDSGTTSVVCSTGGCEAKYALTADKACEACPENCEVCIYNSDNSAVECTDCKVKYGIVNGDCGECPYKCDECSVSSAEGASETLLICDDCSDGYFENDAVCGDCPSNCMECTDNDGTMVCDTCNDGYAKDPTNVCVKCPGNCDKCSASASAVTCTECDSGYGLSVDKLSCTDCASAAFESCATCTSIDAVTEKATCITCDSGYVMIDNDGSKGCASTSVLECGFGSMIDNPSECSDDGCVEGFTLTDDHLCAKMCYVCGDVENDIWVEKTSCVIPADTNDTSTATANDATTTYCTSGICYASIYEGNVNAGCLPSDDEIGECDADRVYEACKNRGTDEEAKEVCDQCCTENLCNTFVESIDGETDSAGMMAVNVLLLCVTALVAKCLI